MNIHKQISNHLPFNGKLINRVMAGFFFSRVLCYVFLLPFMDITPFISSILFAFRNMFP